MADAEKKKMDVSAYEASLIIKGSKDASAKKDDRKIEYVKEFQSP